ncbi:MAG: putative addiction module antidote protein [Dehalococcoidia bacterium]|nr:putative addiction module antidote protein [Dehalococcoidia bacterium]
MSKEEYMAWDFTEYLTDDEMIIEYLMAALEEDDPEFFTKAVGDVARARSMTAVAEESYLAQANLYRAMSGERDPRIGTVMKVLSSLGIRLAVAPKAP